MPRRHRAGIEKQDPATEVRPGQRWEHRWKGNSGTVVQLLAQTDQVLVDYSGRERVSKRETFLRDYRLLG